MISFKINDEPLPLSEAFPYLGRMIAYNNSGWPAVFHNLKKAWIRQRAILRVLKKTGSMVRVRGIMYKALAQTVLLCSRES